MSLKNFCRFQIGLLVVLFFWFSMIVFFSISEMTDSLKRITVNYNRMGL